MLADHLRIVHGAVARAHSFLGFVVLSAFVAPAALADVYRFVPPTVDGSAPNDNYWIGPLSADGRHVVFTSEATNLVSGDTVRCGIRSCIDVFVYDRDADADGVFDEPGATATTLASRASNGESANNESYAPSISDDGRYVAFTSYANNLAPGDSGVDLDVFVHDRQTGQTEIASVSSSGEKALGGTDYTSGVISGNGRVVVFSSNASNLVPGDTNGGCDVPNRCVDVFAHDRVTGQTTRVSVSTQGVQAFAGVYTPAVSADGRFVAFSADAWTLVEGDTNGVQDVFVHDTLTGVTERVSVTSDGSQGDAPSFGQRRPAISADGRLVVFASAATNIPQGAMHDRATRQTLPACVNPAGVTQVCQHPTLSHDGGRLAFEGFASVIVRDLRHGRSIAIGEGYSPSISGNGRFVTFLSSAGSFIADLDVDADGLWNDFEETFGLDPRGASGANGPDGDPDADGRSNAQEFEDGTHPRGFFKRYFAEGATSDFFKTTFALLNPGVAPARTWLQFVGRDGASKTHTLVVGAGTRVTLVAGDLPGMANSEFSTRIDSDQEIVVDRTLTWDRTTYGSHAEASIPSPSTTWYLAEGATHRGFQLFYLLQNPNASEARVRVRYLRPDESPLEKNYALPPNSRTNIWVNVEEFPGLGPALTSTDVSAVLEVLNGQPIIVERAMYLDLPGQKFGAGHASAGVTAPASEWFLAEGATGEYFDLFVLIANPGPDQALVEATYLLPDGTTIAKQYGVAGNSRFNIWVDKEDARLADTAVSTRIESLNGTPIVVERAMWWPGDVTTWHEAHNSPGATSTGTTWALAEGEVAGEQYAVQTDTFILIANVSPFPGRVKVRLVFEDGTFAERVFGVSATSRLNVWVRSEFPEAFRRRFGAVIESLGEVPAQIVVERAMYSDALEYDLEQPGNFRRVPWAAGTNALATRLR